MAQDAKDRRNITESLELSGEYRYSLGHLLELCGNRPEACISIDWCGDEADLRLVWQRCETDEEWALRLARQEAHALARARRQQQRQLKAEQRAQREAEAEAERERALYLQLKAKYEPTNKD